MIKPQLTYYECDEDVIAFSTTRHGGYSKGNYGELNVNSYCGDDPADLSANLQLLATELSIPAERIVMPHQVHGIACRAVTDDLFDLPQKARLQLLDKVDSVMTDVRSVCIGVSTADCIPVLLYDPVHHAVAAIHAGWRGTLQGIVRQAVGEMCQDYHADPRDLKAVIGPGISLENFEVGEEVYDAFAHAGYDMGRIARKYTKWHVNLPLCNRLQLEQAGVEAESIIDTGICTYDHVADYFSARRLGKASGRIFTGILLKE